MRMESFFFLPFIPKEMPRYYCRTVLGLVQTGKALQEALTRGSDYTMESSVFDAHCFITPRLKKTCMRYSRGIKDSSKY